MSARMRYPRLTIYSAADGVRWRIQAANWRIVADSGESYVSDRNALKGAAAALSAPFMRYRVPMHCGIGYFPTYYGKVEVYRA